MRGPDPPPAFAPTSGEHRLYPASTVIELEVQVGDRVDERQVAERLREVAQLLAGQPDLLRVEIRVVGVRAHLLGKMISSQFGSWGPRRGALTYPKGLYHPAPAPPMSMKIPKINGSAATPIKGLITKISPKRTPGNDKILTPQSPPGKQPPVPLLPAVSPETPL